MRGGRGIVVVVVGFREGVWFLIFWVEGFRRWVWNKNAIHRILKSRYIVRLCLIIFNSIFVV